MRGWSPWPLLRGRCRPSRRRSISYNALDLTLQRRGRWRPIVIIEKGVQIVCTNCSRPPSRQGSVHRRRSSLGSGRVVQRPVRRKKGVQVVCADRGRAACGRGIIRRRPGSRSSGWWVIRWADSRNVPRRAGNQQLQLANGLLGLLLLCKAQPKGGGRRWWWRRARRRCGRRQRRRSR